MNRRLFTLFILICLFLSACTGPEAGELESAPTDIPIPPMELEAGSTIAPLSDSGPPPSPLAPGQTDSSGLATSDPTQPLVFPLPTPGLVGDQGPLTGNLDRAVRSVVKLKACQSVGQPCWGGEGSGALVHSQGWILTALHGLVQDPADLQSPLWPEFLVQMASSQTQPAVSLYRAVAAAVNPNLDTALLRIVTDAAGTPLPPNLRLPTLPLVALDGTAAAAGPLRMMGFPAGDPLLKGPELSWYGVTGDGRWQVLHPAARPGLSGGPLLWNDPQQGFLIAGITFFQSEAGVVDVRPVTQLAGFTWVDPIAPRAWLEAVTVETGQQPGPDLPRISLELHALDLAGLPGRVTALALDAETGQPWPTPENPFSFAQDFVASRFVDRLSLILQPSLEMALRLPALPQRLRFRLTIERGDGSRPLWQEQVWYLHQETRPTAPMPSPAPSALATIPATATPSPVSATTCFSDHLADLEPALVTAIELGNRAHDLNLPIQPPAGRLYVGPVGVLLTQLGDPIGALRFRFLPADTYFAIESVVDSACQPVSELRNLTRGGDGASLNNWDAVLLPLTGRGQTLRFGWQGDHVRFSFRPYDLEQDPAASSATHESTVPTAGALWANPVDNAVYIYVPAGEFVMGSEGGGEDERPPHTVYLDGYWIMRTEVTNAQYTSCVQTGVCTAPNNSLWNNSTYAQHPVTDVDWNQASGYAAWAGGRLPTAAQWEKAACGTDGRTYPWGNASPNDRLLNYSGGNVGNTTEVGVYLDGVSPYGGLDMAGNVWEWTADWYASDYYAASPPRNPTGPVSGNYRVLRGGSFGDLDRIVRCAFRGYSLGPNSSDVSIGFRVVSPGL